MPRFLVLVSKPLPLDGRDPAWATLRRIAEIRIRPASTRRTLGREPRLPRADAVVTLVADRVDEEFLERAARVKVISNFAVGFNNINVTAASRRGVLVCNTPDVLTNATAELTIGLLLAAARRFKEGAELIRAARFRGLEPDLLLGAELSGARIGVIGAGRIGSAVARKAEALGMEVIAITRSRGCLEDLLRASDFVSLHCPLTAETRGLMGARQFALMKPGAVLVNTSRGELIDERALVASLRNGRLSAAALDVFCGEPRLRAELRQNPRVFVLPHLGSATHPARAGMARLALRAITDVLTGRPPSNRVI